MTSREWIDTAASRLDESRRLAKAVLDSGAPVEQQNQAMHVLFLSEMLMLRSISLSRLEPGMMQ